MRFPFLNDEVRDRSKVEDRFLSYGLNEGGQQVNDSQEQPEVDLLNYGNIVYK